MSKRSLKAALASGEFIAAPGVHDMIAATIANKVGFDFVYASGYWLTASAYGIPDAGIVTYTQMVDRVATLARVCNAGVIADADTGFGGLLNVHHTVRGYEEAGAQAIQMEDQEFPKKCGHTPGRRVTPPEEMVDKIKVAVDARRSEDFLVIARTDARQPEGFAQAVERGQAYAEAGADVIFVEALESEEEMREACKAIDAPMIANMATGGYSPIFSTAQLQDIGYTMAIFPALGSLVSAGALEKAYSHLRTTGEATGHGADVFDFNEFCELIGFPDVWEFEKKWAK